VAQTNISSEFVPAIYKHENIVLFKDLHTKVNYLKIFNKALTPTEIDKLSPSDKSLIGYWIFNDSIKNDIIDLTGKSSSILINN
jgi:hypothetical protein